MSDMMIPFLQRPLPGVTQRASHRIEKHTNVRKSVEDDKDATDETYHPINDVIQQHTQKHRQHISKQKDSDDNNEPGERLDIFV